MCTRTCARFIYNCMNYICLQMHQMLVYLATCPLWTPMSVSRVLSPFLVCCSVLQNICSEHFFLPFLSLLTAEVLNLYTFACTHTLTNALTYTHTHTHTHTYTDIHSYIHTDIHSYIHTNIQTYIHTYIHTDIQASIQTNIHAKNHIYVQTYIHKYMHACVTYIYSHTHIQISVQARTHTRTKKCICVFSQQIILHILSRALSRRGGGLGSRPIFKKFNEPYAPS